MDLNKPVQISIKPIKFIIVGIILILLLMNVYSWFNNSDLRARNNAIDYKIDSLVIVNKKIAAAGKKDSIKNVQLQVENKDLDSLYKILDLSEQKYKNQWYKLYKKAKDEKANYTASDRAKRDSLAVILARKKW